MRTRENMKTRRRLKFYRKFFRNSLSILEMILKAYDNDLVLATESLMLENGMLRFPTPPVSPKDSTSPSIFVTSDSEQSPSDARLSAFSPVVEHNYSPPTLPSHVIPPFTPATFPTLSMIRPYIPPRKSYQHCASTVYETPCRGGGVNASFCK